MPLTHKEIQKLIGEGKRQRKKDVPNLYLDVEANGSARWLARIKINGKDIPIMLGKQKELSQKDARDLVSVVVRLLKPVGGGHSVQAIRNALALTTDAVKLTNIVSGQKVNEDASTDTFGALAIKWLEEERLPKIPLLKDQKTIHNRVQILIDALGNRPVNQIRRKELIDIIKPICKVSWDKGDKIRGYCRHILEQAVYNEDIDFNPTPNSEMLGGKPKPEERNHHPSAPYKDIKSLWQWIQNDCHASYHTKQALRLLILTGVRTKQIRMLEWSHIDWNEKILISPESVMKKNKVHRVPLSSTAIEILTDLHKYNHNKLYVTAYAEQPLSENTINNAAKKWGKITGHGFRATIRTWAADRGYFEAVLKMIAAHQRDATDAAYTRTDLLEQRRPVMQEWADYITGIITNE